MQGCFLPPHRCISPPGAFGLVRQTDKLVFVEMIHWKCIHTFHLGYVFTRILNGKMFKKQEKYLLHFDPWMHIIEEESYAFFWGVCRKSLANKKSKKLRGVCRKHLANKKPKNLCKGRKNIFLLFYLGEIENGNNMLFYKGTVFYRQCTFRENAWFRKYH